MSEAACKAAACAGQCLDSIVVDNFRELTDVTANLAANNQLNDEQLGHIIDLYTAYEDEVRRRKRMDREARDQLKQILNL